MQDTKNQEQPKRKLWRLRTRLAAGLGVLFLAIFSLIAYSHFQYLDDRRDSRLEDMQRVSQTVAASFDGLIYDFESFALSTAITLGDARVEISESMSPEARASLNDYLQHLLESHGLLRTVFVTDSAGRIVIGDHGVSLGLDLSSRDYITALQAGEPKYWSGGFAGSATGRMIISHSRPIVTPEGVTSGFLVVVIDAAALPSRLPEGLAGDGHISIVDRNGTVILQVPAEAAVPIGTNIANWPVLDAVRSGDRVLVEGDILPVAPEDEYGALIPLDTLGWVVSFSLPSSSIEGATTGLFVRDILGLGAIVLAAFVVMWMFASRVVQPLVRLTDVAGSISRGEATADTPIPIVSSNAEVVLLAETMADMRAAINQREERLRAQNRAMDALEKVGELLASELNLERSIEAIIEAGEDLVGAEAVQLFYQEQDERMRLATTGSKPSLALLEDDPIVRDARAGKITRPTSGGEAIAEPAGGAATARSVIALPIRTRSDEVDGVVVFLHSAAGAFTNQHVRLAIGLTRWASIGLENARLYAGSQELVSQLARSNEEKDEFLGIVSHELRTPITTIYGGTLLLRLRRANLPEEAFNDMIVSIAEEAERLHHLVEDLLAIARTELVKELRQVEVLDALQTAIADFGTTHKRPVKLTAAPDLPDAMGDSTYFRQVVTNLISNADKYSPPDQPLEIVATTDGRELMVRVLDRGGGVAETDLSQIFESFFRAKGASEMASGSGLGLTVCKRLVEAMDGRIWAENRPEGGLEVGFTLQTAASPVSGTLEDFADRDGAQVPPNNAGASSPNTQRSSR